MKLESRELFVSFWDAEYECGVYALLIAWNDELLPVVAYNHGLCTVAGRFEVWTDLDAAKVAAGDLRGP